MVQDTSFWSWFSFLNEGRWGFWRSSEPGTALVWSSVCFAEKEAETPQAWVACPWISPGGGGTFTAWKTANAANQSFPLSPPLENQPLTHLLCTGASHPALSGSTVSISWSLLTSASSSVNNIKKCPLHGKNSIHWRQSGKRDNDWKETKMQIIICLCDGVWNGVPNATILCYFHHC